MPFKPVEQQTVTHSLDGSFLAAYSPNEHTQKKWKIKLLPVLSSQTRTFKASLKEHTVHTKCWCYIFGWFLERQLPFGSVLLSWCTIYARELWKREAGLEMLCVSGILGFRWAWSFPSVQQPSRCSKGLDVSFPNKETICGHYLFLYDKSNNPIMLKISEVCLDVLVVGTVWI